MKRSPTGFTRRELQLSACPNVAADGIALHGYYLVECGTDCSAGLSDDDFRERIRKQYPEVLVGVY